MLLSASFICNGDFADAKMVCKATALLVLGPRGKAETDLTDVTELCLPAVALANLLGHASVP